MGLAHVVVSNALLARIRDPNGDIRHRVSVIESSPFCDETHLILICTPILRDGYHYQQDIIIEDDGTIRFQRDADLWGPSVIGSTIGVW